MRCARRCGAARRRRTVTRELTVYSAASDKVGAGEPHRDKSTKGAPGHRYLSGAERKVDERSVGCAIARRATPGGSMVATRSLQKGVTLNVALARSAFCGFCEVVFRERHSVVVVTHGSLSLFTSQLTLGMTESLRRRLQQALIYAYISAVSVVTLCLLAFREWDIPAPFPSKFWNAIAAFVILGILSESFSFTIPVANVRTSVSFVPFIASVALFQHPWPMLIGGLTAFVADTFVRHKPFIRVWFNTAQFMLASGAGALVYTALGGSVSLERFGFQPLPFACLVIAYFWSTTV